MSRQLRKLPNTYYKRIIFNVYDNWWKLIFKLMWISIGIFLKPFSANDKTKFTEPLK